MINMPTKRDILEETILKLFNENVRPITRDDNRLTNKFGEKRYSVSFLSYLLYANGYNKRGKSTDYPLGLMYDDGTTRFAIGFFRKEHEQEDRLHMHIIGPVGDLKAVDDFVQKVSKIPEIQAIDGFTSYVRHLTSEQKKQLNNLGYETITADSGEKKWHPTAFAEDETYNHRLVNLEELIGRDGKKRVGKFGQATRTFERIISKRYAFEIEEYTTTKVQEAEFIIKSYFERLREKGKAIGSTWEDYRGVVENLPAGKNGKDYFAYIGYLKQPESAEKRPVMLFIGERTGKNSAALYACFALRGIDLPEEAQKDYDNGISPYSYAEVFVEMQKASIKTVDVGGSENGLDQFKKEKLMAKEVKTYWVAK